MAVERAIRPEAIAFALFGLVAMLTMFFLVGQLATRQLSQDELSMADDESRPLADKPVRFRGRSCLGLLVVGVFLGVRVAAPHGQLGQARGRYAGRDERLGPTVSDV